MILMLHPNGKLKPLEKKKKKKVYKNMHIQT